MKGLSAGVAINGPLAQPTRRVSSASHEQGEFPTVANALLNWAIACLKRPRRAHGLRANSCRLAFRLMQRAPVLADAQNSSRSETVRPSSSGDVAGNLQPLLNVTKLARTPKRAVDEDRTFQTSPGAKKISV